MDIKQIFQNNQEWVDDKLSTDQDYFKKLAKGQKPTFLYIGCSDSRVTAEDLMGIEPGEAFVHRNIANMVNNNDISVQSVIEYAVTILKVDHIVVCGHYQCGGIKAALENKDMGLLNPWLGNIRNVRRHHLEELNAIENKYEKYDRLVELNVQEQCVNVVKNVSVQKAYAERGITVHGWVVDLATGKLIDLKIDLNEIMEDYSHIYHFKSDDGK